MVFHRDKLCVCPSEKCNLIWECSAEPVFPAGAVWLLQLRGPSPLVDKEEPVENAWRLRTASMVLTALASMEPSAPQAGLPEPAPALLSLGLGL